MHNLKRIILCFILIVSTLSFVPAQSNQVNEQLSIDFSNLENGTVAVSVIDPESSLRYKLKVELDDTFYLYNLDTNAETIIPLQMGNGVYQIELYEQIKDTAYHKVGKFYVVVEIDRKRVWLEPNVKVNFSSPENLLAALAEIVSPTDSDAEKYHKITEFVRGRFVYDWVTAANIRAVPEYADLDRVLERKMGLCEELAALTVAFLRLEGIQARLAIGTSDGITHAWVQAIVGKKLFTFDPSVDKYTQATRTYVAERYY